MSQLRTKYCLRYLYTITWWNPIENPIFVIALLPFISLHTTRRTVSLSPVMRAVMFFYCRFVKRHPYLKVLTWFYRNPYKYTRHRWIAIHFIIVHMITAWTVTPCAYCNVTDTMITAWTVTPCAYCNVTGTMITAYLNCAALCILQCYRHNDYSTTQVNTLVNNTSSIAFL